MMKKMTKIKGYTKSQIMEAAWKLAKVGAKKFGGKVKQYFAVALKIVWGQIKKMVNVPSWFIGKKTGGIRPVAYSVKGFVERETEKAVLVKIPVLGGAELWCPKSIIE